MRGFAAPDSQRTIIPKVLFGDRQPTSDIVGVIGQIRAFPHVDIYKILLCGVSHSGNSAHILNIWCCKPEQYYHCLGCALIPKCLPDNSVVWRN